MIRPLFLCLLFGCEQIEPTGDPLKPVVVDTLVSDVPDDLVDDDEPLDEEEPFTISSEELAAISDGTEEEKEPSAPLAPPPQVETAPTPEPPPPPPTALPSPPTAASQAWSKAMGKAWPVRLVTTIPNASPPRAILGLPDGQEVVVNPGSMVPDLGLVVVAISPGSAELAKIAPAGDHATIESITLRAQY